jgi:hypothetical protein
MLGQKTFKFTLGGEPNDPNEIFLLPVEFYFPKNDLQTTRAI